MKTLTLLVALFLALPSGNAHAQSEPLLFEFLCRPGQAELERGLPADRLKSLRADGALLEAFLREPAPALRRLHASFDRFEELGSPARIELGLEHSATCGATEVLGSSLVRLGCRSASGAEARAALELCRPLNRKVEELYERLEHR